MNFHKITYPDVNNGLGCRVSLWCSGCTHHCEGCHNKITWDFKSGKEFTKEYEDKLFNILSLPYIKGLTLTGGEPLDNLDKCIDIVKKSKEMYPEKDIWVFTGYKMEEIKESKSKKQILEYIDYIVTGRFVKSLKDTCLAFRGSSNQIIWEKKGSDFQKSELN